LYPLNDILGTPLVCPVFYVVAVVVVNSGRVQYGPCRVVCPVFYVVAIVVVDSGIYSPKFSYNLPQKDRIVSGRIPSCVNI